MHSSDRILHPVHKSQLKPGAVPTARTCVGIKTCPNRAEVSKLYNEGKLTEYSGWGNEPRHWNSPLDDRIDYEKDDCKPKWPTSTYV